MNPSQQESFLTVDDLFIKETHRLPSALDPSSPQSQQRRAVLSFGGQVLRSISATNVEDDRVPSSSTSKNEATGPTKRLDIPQNDPSRYPLHPTALRLFEKYWDGNVPDHIVWVTQPKEDSSKDSMSSISSISISLDQIPEIDEQPPGIDEQPSEIDEQPPKIEEQPPKIDDQPPEINEQPSEVDDQPSEIDDQPFEIDEQPSETDEQPSEVDEPPELNEQPSEVDDQPSEIDEQPFEIDEQPSDIDDQPSEIDDQPSEIDEQPSEVDEPPEIDEQTPEITESIPESSGQKRKRTDEGSQVRAAVEDTSKDRQEVGDVIPILDSDDELQETEDWDMGVSQVFLVVDEDEEVEEKEAKEVVQVEEEEEEEEEVAEVVEVTDTDDKEEEERIRKKQRLQEPDESIHDDSVQDNSIQDNSILIQDNSTQDSSTQDNSIQDNSIQDNSIQDNSIHDNSIQDNSVQDNSAQDNSAQDNSIQDNSIQDNSIQDNSIQDISTQDDLGSSFYAPIDLSSASASASMSVSEYSESFESSISQSSNSSSSFSSIDMENDTPAKVVAVLLNDKNVQFSDMIRDRKKRNTPFKRGDYIRVTRALALYEEDMVSGQITTVTCLECPGKDTTISQVMPRERKLRLSKRDRVNKRLRGKGKAPKVRENMSTKDSRGVTPTGSVIEVESDSSEHPKDSIRSTWMAGQRITPMQQRERFQALYPLKFYVPQKTQNIFGDTVGENYLDWSRYNDIKYFSELWTGPPLEPSSQTSCMSMMSQLSGPAMSQSSMPSLTMSQSQSTSSPISPMSMSQSQSQSSQSSSQPSSQSELPPQLKLHSSLTTDLDYSISDTITRHICWITGVRRAVIRAICAECTNKYVNYGCGHNCRSGKWRLKIEMECSVTDGSTEAQIKVDDQEDIMWTLLGLQRNSLARGTAEPTADSVTGAGASTDTDDNNDITTKETTKAATATTITTSTDNNNNNRNSSDDTIDAGPFEYHGPPSQKPVDNDDCEDPKSVILKAVARRGTLSYMSYESPFPGIRGKEKPRLKLPVLRHDDYSHASSDGYVETIGADNSERAKMEEKHWYDLCALRSRRREQFLLHATKKNTSAYLSLNQKDEELRSSTVSFPNRNVFTLVRPPLVLKAVDLERIPPQVEGRVMLEYLIGSSFM
ncbi:hypothetical protein BGX34_000549 [Mortierella sp. NVP85]|nr:hypothetical protein BGX34_000549 [Mortierella sp. NVP85]